MCLALGGVGGVGFELYQFWKNIGKWGFGFGGVGGVGGECAAWARVWEGGVCCESGFSVLLAGPGICILC